MTSCSLEKIYIGFCCLVYLLFLVRQSYEVTHTVEVTYFSHKRQRLKMPFSTGTDISFYIQYIFKNDQKVDINSVRLS